MRARCLATLGLAAPPTDAANHAAEAAAATPGLHSAWPWEKIAGRVPSPRIYNAARGTDQGKGPRPANGAAAPSPKSASALVAGHAPGHYSARRRKLSHGRVGKRPGRGARVSVGGTRAMRRTVGDMMDSECDEDDASSRG
ncbi:hypothetical protein HPB48_025508 [Haemaphysalis longicornis]|uniref:Uncharacterized protein n=1 Tax=Haemaphysalis longicornis TaxID=44386 RepID=A0A9J6H7Q8_HAELO|nr:hypothetical protein HPB48_025508 [Haemaphysalis longicornis]